MNLLSIVATLFLSAIIYYIFDWITKGRIGRMIDKLPGPLKLPFIGTSLTLLITPREDLMRKVRNEVKNESPPLVRTWLGYTPEVLLLSPQTIEPILNSSVQISKAFLYTFAHLWLGEGLLTSTGKKWHTHRKLLTPAFHFTILENFVEVFAGKSKLLVAQLESKTNGEIFDLHPYITRCTLDIICETAMGVEINAMSNPENEYVKNIYNITTATVERLIKPWLHPEFIFYRTNRGKRYKQYVDKLHKFTSNIIKERRKELMNKKEDSRTVDEIGRKIKKTFLDILLETSFLDDQELREEVDTFMFEGHDTTTGGICWTLFLLGNHPDIQEKVHHEIKTVFEESNGNLAISDLGKLRLLERCIKESLRLYPSVPVIARKLTEDVTLGEYIIPKGCAVNIPIFLIHNSEKIYPEPEKFDPDRFLPENVKDRHPYAYIPFSAGPRNCIGQKFAMYEEKIVLAYILKKYKVTSVEDEQTVKPMMELTLKSKNGLLVKLAQRC